MSYEEYDGHIYDPKCPDCNKKLRRWWQPSIERFYCANCQKNLWEKEVQ